MKTTSRPNYGHRFHITGNGAKEIEVKSSRCHRQWFLLFKGGFLQILKIYLTMEDCKDDQPPACRLM